MTSQKSWKNLQKEFLASPISEKINLPSFNSQKGQALLYLFQNKGRVVKKSAAERVICSRMNIPTKDIQSLRHLSKQDGFNILQGGACYDSGFLKRGEYLFVDFNDTCKYWEMNRRDESDLDFSSLKEKFEHKCATCGEEEGTLHRYTGEKVKLEKGHMNPGKPMTDENIIPQCGFCNKIYKDSFEFGMTGFVKKPTVKGVLSTMSNEEQKEILSLLKEKFGVTAS